MLLQKFGVVLCVLSRFHQHTKVFFFLKSYADRHSIMNYTSIPTSDVIVLACLYKLVGPLSSIFYSTGVECRC